MPAHACPVKSNFFQGSSNPAVQIVRVAQMVRMTNSPFPTVVFEREPSLVAASIASLRDIVSSIKEGTPLPPMLGINDLFMRAAQMRGTPGNLQEWARQLATDIGEFTD